MQKILKEKLSEQVYRILREMITNCRFLPGSRINIEQLSRDMEISRTPLWEAVNRLIREGVLVSVPNRGVFAADITPEAALEIYSVRERLEGLAARLAAANVHSDAVARMEHSLVRQREMVEKRDLIGYSRHDYEFHDVMYELSGNGFLQEILDLVRARTRPTMLNFMPLLKASCEDHLAILESLKAGDGAAAERRVRVHIRRIGRQLAKTISGSRGKSEQRVEKRNP